MDLGAIWVDSLSIYTNNFRHRHCQIPRFLLLNVPLLLRHSNHTSPPLSAPPPPDPFADATKGDDRLPAGTEDYIHIRIQQRNGRKTLTTVQGIAIDYDKKKLVKAFKKKFACNGTVIEHPEYGEVIQLQGDQRKNICQFLIDVASIGLAKEEQLKLHGF
ncbi:eukaryotic translation initiation factor 1 [Diretmus argenteus]